MFIGYLLLPPNLVVCGNELASILDEACKVLGYSREMHRLFPEVGHWIPSYHLYILSNINQLHHEKAKHCCLLSVDMIKPLRLSTSPAYLWTLLETIVTLGGWLFLYVLCLCRHRHASRKFSARSHGAWKRGIGRSFFTLMLAPEALKA